MNTPSEVKMKTMETSRRLVRALWPTSELILPILHINRSVWLNIRHNREGNVQLLKDLSIVRSRQQDLQLAVLLRAVKGFITFLWLSNWVFMCKSGTCTVTTRIRHIVVETRVPLYHISLTLAKYLYYVFSHSFLTASTYQFCILLRITGYYFSQQY
jgi:hypothetical protein